MYQFLETYNRYFNTCNCIFIRDPFWPCQLNVIMTITITISDISVLQKLEVTCRGRIQTLLYNVLETSVRRDNP